MPVPSNDADTSPGTSTDVEGSTDATGTAYTHKAMRCVLVLFVRGGGVCGGDGMGKRGGTQQQKLYPTNTACVLP